MSRAITAIRRDGGAFTLIELLLVLVIVGSLAAIVIRRTVGSSRTRKQQRLGARRRP